MEVKKKKKKVNGPAVAIVKNTRAKRRKIRNKLVKAANKEESKKTGPDKTVSICSVFDSKPVLLSVCANQIGPLCLLKQHQKEESVTAESLDAVLTELTRVNNSKERASKLFQWLLKPVPAKYFFR